MADESGDWSTHARSSFRGLMVLLLVHEHDFDSKQYDVVVSFKNAQGDLMDSIKPDGFKELDKFVKVGPPLYGFCKLSAICPMDFSNIFQSLG